MPAVKGQKIEAKYDGEKLYMLIKEGKNAKEIMAELGVKSMPTLKSHLFKLMTEKKEYLEIPGSSTRGRATSPVYRRGKIVLTKNMLAGVEFPEGQKFKLEKGSDRLVLVPA
ncbi:hypothetical protein JCM15519_19320 [Fundidesulfovibrio butyratiphilus]